MSISLRYDSRPTRLLPLFSLPLSPSAPIFATPARTSASRAALFTVSYTHLTLPTILLV